MGRVKSERRSGGYMPPSIMAATGLDHVDKVIYGAIYCAQGQGDDVEIGYSTLGKMTNTDRRSVRESILSLVTKGFITQIRRPGRGPNSPGLYRVDLVALRNQRKMFAEMRERQERNRKIRTITPSKRRSLA